MCDRFPHRPLHGNTLCYNSYILLISGFKYLNILQQIPFKKIFIVSIVLSLLFSFVFGIFFLPPWIPRNLVSLVANMFTTSTLLLGILLFILFFFVLSSIINSIKLNLQDNNVFKKNYLTSVILAVIPGVFFLVVGFLMNKISICPLCDEYGIILYFGLVFIPSAILISIVLTSIVHIFKKSHSSS
jgi:hypothetical protein